jgi:transcriptional regulator with XRE-family HTH domain
MGTYPGITATTRGELSEFLKSRRARISPASAGIPNRGRRRTPGLRREEVADLAAVGVTWYTWLEQGRDIRVSVDALNRIAAALRLEPAERTHLFRLAGHAAPAQKSASDLLSPRLQRVLDAWDPYPAHITGRRRDVLAWNKAGDLIHKWTELPIDRRNILWSLFMVPSARHLHADWAQAVPLSVAALRAEAGHHLGDPDYRLLIDELIGASQEFAALWGRQDVRGREGGAKHFNHPQLGRLGFEYTPFEIPEQPSMRLYLFTPTDERTERKMREVAAASRR